jgi:hypothetical protein
MMAEDMGGAIEGRESGISAAGAVDLSLGASVSVLKNQLC